MADYCLPSVVKTIDNMGGLDDGGVLPRKIDLSSDGLRQFGLFDES